MHDLNEVLRQGHKFDEELARRHHAGLPSTFLSRTGERKAALAQLQAHQAERNQLAAAIGTAKRQGIDTATFEAQGIALRQTVDQLTERVGAIDAELHEILASLPNSLDHEVPPGLNEASNVEKSHSGQIKNFAFPPREHFELGEALGLMDFTTAGKIAGARFTVLRGDLARLERALGQFMIDLHTSKHGYTEIAPPLLVNDATLFGTAQLPKFAEDLFKTTDGRWLIPTAEVPLTNLVSGEIIDVAKLPLRFTALTPSFRSEAGSAGRDTRGMLRQHQFWKVELVSITTPDASADEHERMTICAETVLKELDLPYRRMLPGQGTYREISSCSNCHAFQARRMNARYRPAQTGAKPEKPAFVHTLNGSGVAVGRALIAVLENYQNQDGSITIPEVLRPAMGGRSLIQKPA
ncbi:MAG: serine--tRNA ligase [Acidiphilium sp. 34-60-192]|nr:MAG: serine--tRNA ligase [Acidiphilium sp. 34-60-192]